MSDEQRQQLQEIADGRENGNGADPAALLEASRVDLLALIESGIPPRQYVPGSGGVLVQGKRHHIAAEAKTGKTLAFVIVTGVEIVAAGGTVAVCDRENGAEETARRLQTVLDARDADAALRDAIRTRFRYYAWPELRLDWGKSPAYPRAFAGADVVIFDSSRRFLTSVGLKEDGSDDFSQWTDATIDPLMLAGIATVLLDNTGHGDKDRPRGTSSKADLCDVMYALKSVQQFGIHRPGRLELTCTHSRIGEIDGTWAMSLGGGHYSPWKQQTGSDARTNFRTACIAALQAADEPLAREDLINAARKHGGKGKSDTLRDYLADFLGEDAPAISLNADRHYQLNAYPAAGYDGVTGSAGTLTPPPLNRGGVRPLPPERVSRGNGTPNLTDEQAEKDAA